MTILVLSRYKKKLWSFTKLFLKLFITGLSLYLVFKKVKITDVREAFEHANIFYLLFALLFFVISQVIASSRLNTFFKSAGVYLSGTLNFKVYLLGMFYNLFLPGGIGGDGYKVFLLKKKYNARGRDLLLSIFFDRLSGLWALCLITSVFIVFIPGLHIPIWIPIVVMILGTGVYWLVIYIYFNKYNTHFLQAHIKALLVQSMLVICAIFLLYALHLEGGYLPYLLVFLVSSLVAIFPFTVGGLGARELVFVYGANYLALNQHMAVLISLLFYCISAMMCFSGAYFVFNPGKLVWNNNLSEPSQVVEEVFEEEGRLLEIV
jgi:uncharacterized membrane protein YbhN (UPF0104 family)